MPAAVTQLHPDAKARQRMLTAFLRQADKAASTTSRGGAASVERLNAAVPQAVPNFAGGQR